MRKAQFIKFKNNKDDSSIMRHYFEESIRTDRRYISLFIQQMTGKDFTKTHGYNFDTEVIEIMQKNGNFREVNVKINGDVSYNIAFNPRFKDVTYYEFILPYISNTNQK